jgi:uncharacterized lipoprotein YddW (UPF0748 family)
VLPFVPGSRFGVGLEFGYGERSREQFESETGQRAPTEGDMVNLSRWDEWRREQVTRLVAQIAQRTRAIRPQLELSAAVIAYADRAYLSLAQDWLRWLEDGSIDFAVPMIYTLDDRLLRYQAEHFAGAPNGERIWAGLGSWLFASRPQRAVEQLAVAQRAGMRHHAFFSYDAMAEADAAGERLLLEALAGATALPAGGAAGTAAGTANGTDMDPETGTAADGG